MLRRLGLGYKKYDVCVNNCILYYGEYESQCYLQCPVCEEPRFKQCDVHYAKLISRKSLWLGLCTDGFTPFGHSASPYSCWPVFVSVYNLPPTMCMKQEYVFLSLIIQGLQSPGQNIDVMSRPLIDDLKQLWYSGVQTYDSFRRQYFLMRAALMWTISDLLGYGMLSRWSTHGKLTCPYCMENLKAFWLEHGQKTSFFYYHRQFLPPDHPFRRNKNDFMKGRTENGTMPKRLSSYEMHSRIHWLPDILPHKQGIHGFGEVISDEFINVHEHIKGLSSGPKNYVSCYNGYIVNGFQFHIALYGRNKRTMNYDYKIPPPQRVQVDQKRQLVDINPRRYLRSYEPFILASQARFIEIHEKADVGEEIGEEDEEGEWEDFETSEEENIETYVEENDSSDE
ncbi:hypothetical protein SLEP1_g51803 [Rubroshorea leprosula]|uniref:Transposase-associated domain-containing protein n=1 Tax=Rubroshorea leprosula TaxID=152421 RepID=A0AAV5M4I0_9ROSI|nr:hypothetical protein SLEP1_g51803 [Rubroshorea leprosula]